MENLNKVELRGFVGKVRTDNIGDNVMTRFSLATNRAYKGESGENIIETTWHNCVGFGEKYAGIKKNDIVHLLGRIKISRVTDADGEPKQSFEIIVNDLIAD